MLTRFSLSAAAPSTAPAAEKTGSASTFGAPKQSTPAVSGKQLCIRQNFVEGVFWLRDGVHELQSESRRLTLHTWLEC